MSQRICEMNKMNEKLQIKLQKNYTVKIVKSSVTDGNSIDLENTKQLSSLDGFSLIADPP